MDQSIAHSPQPSSGAVDVTGAVRQDLVRNDWTRAEMRALFDLPFPELIFQAQRVHRLHFDPREVQISTLLSIKTGGCPEDCAYCPQSAHYETGVKADKLMDVEAVLAEARAAKDARRDAASAWARPGATPEGPRPRRRSATWSKASRRSGSKPARRSAC